MRFGAHYVAVAGFLWACPSSQAAAEPITAVYTVHITERFHSTHTNQRNPTARELYNAEFPLALTFDPTLSTSFSAYGPPTFSPDILSIPLPRPVVPDGLDFRSESHTSHSPFLASALESLHGTTSPNWFAAGYRALLFLEGHSGTERSPQTFPSDLTFRGGFPTFFYSACAVFGRSPEAECVGSRFEHVEYFGHLTLNSVSPGAPVPEPGTMILVGSALAGLALRRRARRQS